MKPDYERAAIAAMKILVDHKITETPIVTMPILKNFPGVRVMSFTHMADEAGVDRDDLVPLFSKNQDAATFLLGMPIEGVKYVVVYNMRLPHEIICRGLAREFGHIVLGHDGITRPYEIRRAEAMCFAHHLLSPRPIIQLLRESGIPITMNVLSDTTGCIDECVDDMREIPGVHVPAELNRKVRDLFARGISEYARFHQAAHKPDKSPVVDFGTFMENYEE